MTSDIAAIGLTYAGVDIQDIEGIFLEITQGLFETGDTRGVDVVVPGLNGQLVRPRRFDTRRILLAGFVRGTGDTHSDRRANYRTNNNTLRTLFSETAVPDDLVALTEDGSQWTVPCRCIPDGRISNEMVQSEFAIISIELLALEDWTVEVAGS